jgi:hypothetical protein
VVLSVLLGAHPAWATAAELLRLTSDFGIREPTLRVTLTRMVGAGDLVRSAAAGPNGFALDRFAGVVRGLRASARIDAGPEDWVRAPRYVTLMLVVRFLTDHLEGDRYFRVERRGDNLERAEAQWRLLLQMEQAADAMAAAIE